MAAAGFSPVTLPLFTPFWFPPKPQHLEENDYAGAAANTTYQQLHTPEERAHTCVCGDDAEKEREQAVVSNVKTSSQ